MRGRVIQNVRKTDRKKAVMHIKGAEVQKEGNCEVKLENP